MVNFGCLATNHMCVNIIMCDQICDQILAIGVHMKTPKKNG